MSHGHVVECGAVAPLCNEVSQTEKDCSFTLVRALWLQCLSLQFRGHTRRPTNYQSAVPISSLQELTLRLIIFARRSASTFCTARCSALHKFSWDLEAWAVFSNHYHFVAKSPRDSEDASTLSRMLGVLHARTAAWINRLDGQPRRKVWHNFWDTKLTYQKSYLARLNYVHQNAVKHGLVPVANQYQWCSARWFEQIASPAMVRSIYRFKIDQLSIRDNFAPIVE
jgi:putative transposase